MTHTEEPSSLPSSLPGQIWKRVLYGSVVTILPVSCFILVDLIQPDWQSGQLNDYVALLLTPEASLVFLIMLGYSILCYLLLLVSPLRYAKFWPIRLGIYSGALLAVQYCVLMLLSSGAAFIYIILAWFACVITPVLFNRAGVKWGRRNTIISLIAVSAAVYLGFVFIRSMDFLSPFTFVIIFLVASAPFWGFLLAGRTAVWLLKSFDSGKWSLGIKAGLVAWSAAYIAAWRYDLLKMFGLYSALPTAPPDCYIATAAAKGHPRFVRSREVILPNGQSMRVNAQLQRLKCAELAIMAAAPRLHAILRKLYDIAGKLLAGGIQTPLWADIVYLTLKPAEWISFLVLRLLVPEINVVSKTMYVK